jgi:acetoin utilization protein AcuB
MNAADIMTPSPRSLPPSAPLSQAIDLLKDEQVRHLPVTDDGVVVGILSDRDVRELSLGAVLADDAEAREARLAQPLGPLMMTDVETVTPETEIRLVIDLFLEKRLSAVPVVDPDRGALVGVISVLDVLRAVRDLV